jgi:hypothetical protein
MSSRPRALAVAALTALAFVACLRVIDDPDYWTHLALGRAFVSLGTLNVGEPFVARPGVPGPAPMTAAGWVHALTASSEWPFQIGVYALQDAAGHAAVSVAVALCGALAAAVLAGGLLRPTSVPRTAAAVAFASAAFVLARFRFAPRPEAVAAVLLAAVLVLAFQWAERPRWAPLGGIAGLLLLWRPLHVTWAIGAAFAAAAIGAGPWLSFWRTQRVPVRIASAAAAAIGGVAAARFAVFVIGELGQGGMLFGVTEMRPTWEFPSIAWRFALLAVAGLALAWGGPEGRRPRVAVWAAAAIVGAVVVRNVGLAALGMVAPAFLGLASRPGRPAGVRATRAAAGGCALLLVALLALVLRDRDCRFGAGVDDRLLPREAARFVAARRLESPVFNSWDWGGYLAWAWNGNPRTFLDGRLHDRESLADHEAVISGDPAVIERWGFRTIVLQPLFRNSGRLVPGLAGFLASPEWKLVDASDALVFARQPLPAGLAEVPLEGAWRVIVREADALKDQADLPRHADYTRAIALFRLGDAGGARDAYLAAWRAAPEEATQYPGLAEAVGAR